MLKEKNFPKELWGEAVFKTSFLNRCPTKMLKNITLEECWLRFKPNMIHLKVFGLVAYRHVPGQLRKKLYDKGEKMILVGYHSTDGYKLYDAVNKKNHN